MGFRYCEYFLHIVLVLSPALPECFRVPLAGFLFPRPAHRLRGFVAVLWPSAHSTVQKPKAMGVFSATGSHPSHQNEARPPHRFFHPHRHSCCGWAVTLLTWDAFLTFWNTLFPQSETKGRSPCLLPGPDEIG